MFHALKAVPKTIKKVLKKNNIKIDDIDLFIFHQANKFMLESIQAKLNMGKENYLLVYLVKYNIISSISFI